MENSKLQQLLSNINSTTKLSQQMDKLLVKKQEIVDNINLLNNKLKETILSDNELKQKVVDTYNKLSADIEDKDFIVNVLAKNFELRTPPKKKTNDNLDAISNDIVEFVSLHSGGISMKALAERFSDFDRIKFATHVKLLVDSNCLRKTGNRSTTKYFA